MIEIISFLVYFVLIFFSPTPDDEEYVYPEQLDLRWTKTGQLRIPTSEEQVSTLLIQWIARTLKQWKECGEVQNGEIRSIEAPRVIIWRAILLNSCGEGCSVTEMFSKN
ncbi:hypothetical protein niasHT_032811 [Heterodera trifolii]|uniref:Uncharacterized protein n=1 Tax=Heterodera trifolii TaxID=157864 RepID=A0ABD2IKZ2_9BILA